MKILPTFLIALLGIISIPAFGQNIDPELEEILDNEIFTIVQEMPRFPGCQDISLKGKEANMCAEKIMLEYINTNLEYPEEAIKNGIEGMVVAKFVVRRDGSITDIKIIKGLSEECNNATVKLVSEFPKWIPGKQREHHVNVEYSLPIRFKLDDVKVDSKGN